METGFLTAHLVEGFEICYVGGRSGKGVLGVEHVIRELLLDGVELLLRTDGEEAELELDDAVETPGGVLDGGDEFALDVGLGLVFVR